MMKTTCRYLVFTLLITALILSGCSGKTQKEETSSSGDTEREHVEGGEITIGIAQDLDDSLDPHLAVAAGTKEVLFNIFEGLVKPDVHGELVDAVASEHKISDDGKTYTFTLREGVKFHNGEDVTAEDVKYSIERCAGITDGEPLVPALSVIQSVEIPDEKTVEIQIAEPVSEFLAYLTVAIIPANYGEQATKPVGTGPYKFVSRTPQESIVLEKNEDYWGEKAHLDKITLKIVADADMITTSLKGGSIQMFPRLTSNQVAQLDDSFTVYEGTMNLVQALYLNNAVKPFDDVRVRQALSYAIDPQKIMDMIADGKGVAVGTSMYPGLEKYHMPELADMYAQDFDKAKDLLNQAGYPDGFSMTITVPSNYKPHMETAEVIVEDLKQIGVDAKIEPIEWGSWVSDVYIGRQFQSTVIGVDASYMNARSMLYRFVTDDDDNFVNFSDSEYDELFAKASATTDENELIEIYKRMETILAEQAASAYIQDMAEFVALSDDYGGYVFYPLYVQDFSKIYKYAE